MKTLISCALVGVGLLANVALAGGMEGYGIPSNVSLYGGASAGLTNQEGACVSDSTATDCNDASSGNKFFAGFRATPSQNGVVAMPGGVIPSASLPTLGAEIGQMDLGESTANGTAGRSGIYDTKLTSDLSATYLAGVGYIPVAPRTELLGKVGAAYWKQNGSKVVPEDTSMNTTSSNSGLGMLLGGGAQVQINPNVSLRGEYEHVFGTAADTNYESDASLLSVGAVFSTF
ncbi:outer membrane beta-barrel protein [Thiothrix lacustris]|uniref:Outer membrane beta-barrel protein n=1 Tax=Thiothrix lacustris TaxID=525917 RepID=A0ABY9MQX4_9GAMM|nr:outer membrane beta-barrel protein [Thiothrix lacustris]WML91060.1 outer membrane beta-barrel protein [Thiothrix lacustris]WMP17049.1 outer membrane beta-barrel protein [Thiothrix lacustris]